MNSETRKELLKIVKVIDRLKPGIVTWAFENRNNPRFSFLNVCISDYDFYLHDPRFRKLKDKWHLAFYHKGKPLIFCYCNPLEGELLKLSEQDNLIMDIEGVE